MHRNITINTLKRILSYCLQQPVTLCLEKIWICQIQGRILIWIWFEIQLQIHTFSYLSLTLSYLSFKNKVDLDGFQIKSKSNPNQYTPPGFGKSTKSNTLIGIPSRNLGEESRELLLSCSWHLKCTKNNSPRSTPF